MVHFSRFAKTAAPQSSPTTLCIRTAVVGVKHLVTNDAVLVTCQACLRASVVRALLAGQPAPAPVFYGKRRAAPAPKAKRAKLKAARPAVGCGFCASTAISRACPMCGSTAHLKAAPAPAPVTITVVPARAPKARSFSASMVLTHIRQMEAAGDLNTMAALIVGLAAKAGAMLPELAARRLSDLAMVDRACAARGSITEAERTMRERIVRESILVLGFDPRSEDGPVAEVMAAPAPAQDTRPGIAAVQADVRQLESGVVEPLKAGDWKGLWTRVQRGELTQEQATAFGQVWMNQGA